MDKIVSRPLLLAGAAVVAMLALAGALLLTEWIAMRGAESDVRSRLSDPESARFERMVRNTRTGTVCGFVNARNKLGGYVGPQAFVVDAGVVHFDPGEASTTAPTTEQFERLKRRLEFVERDLAGCPPEFVP